MKIKEAFQYLDEQVIDEQRMKATSKLIMDSWHVQEQKKRISFYEFIRIQFRYISSYTWSLQFLILLFFTSIFFILQMASPLFRQESFFLIFPMFPIMICALSMYEFLKSLSYGMVELESGTLFSFPKILLARAFILVMSDLCIMSIVVFLSSSLMQYPLHYILLYVLVPFNVCICVTLCILHFQKSRNSIYTCLSFMFIYGIFNALIGPSYGAYEMVNIVLWKVLFVVSMLYLFIELGVGYKQLQKKESFFEKEGGNYIWN